MGSAISSFRSEPPSPTRTILIGIEYAGKTTLLYTLKNGGCRSTVGTGLFNTETVTYDDFTLTIQDLSGRGNRPNSWHHFFKDAEGIIYVVDSSYDRISEAREQLWRALNEDELWGLPLLVYANKQDLSSAMSVADVRDELGLRAIRGRAWHIQGASILDGEGIKEGMDWYLAQLRKA